MVVLYLDIAFMMTESETFFFIQLNEHQRHLYAGLKCLDLGYHGVSEVSKTLGLHPHTIRLGQKELANQITLPDNRVRKAGGDRKKIEKSSEISDLFEEIVKDHTAGSPMDSTIVWTDITPSDFVKHYGEKKVKLSPYNIKQLLKIKGFKKRQMSKKGTIKDVTNRDAQFEYIASKKAEFTEKNLPILSIDTKKKEFIGNLYRAGKCYCRESSLVYDHDFPSLATGVLIPNGIFDITKNKGYISIGQSKDTSEFLVDNINYHWQNTIQKDYQDAKEMLLLIDGGVSNSCLHYIVKEDLQKLANALKMTINVTHYPAYFSKCKPIEHRLFPHIQRTWKGVVFKNYQIVKELIEKTTTTNGLKSNRLDK